jgi:hypothetical protein
MQILVGLVNEIQRERLASSMGLENLTVQKLLVLEKVPWKFEGVGDAGMGM